MLEKEEIEFVVDLVKNTVNNAVETAVEKAIERAIEKATEAPTHEHGEEEDEEEPRLMTERLGEDDLIGGNLTNLDNDKEVVHRKANYGYAGTADTLSIFESQAKQFVRWVAKDIMAILRNTNQYHAGEEGRAMESMNATLVGSFTRARRTISEEDEMNEKKNENEGGMF